MIKLSKDGLFLWRYFFGAGIILTHIFFVVFVIAFNFWPVYLVYAFFAAMHFFVGRVWRYLLLIDVYLTEDLKKLICQNTQDESKEYDLGQIIKYRTSFGITDLSIDDGGTIRKVYFMINSKENLKYFTSR